jgi:hypothetical protein
MPGFFERFGLSIDATSPRTWFVNHITALLLHARGLANADDFDRDNYAFGLALKLGQPWGNLASYYSALDRQLPKDFSGLLRALEYLVSEYPPAQSAVLSRWISDAINESPGSLGIRWDGRAFWPSTAPELDAALGEYPLTWLRDKGLDGVAVPYSRALRALVDADSDPTATKSAVRDAYEALECAARLVLANARDLSGNRERLCAELRLPPPLSDSLKSYVTWGNDHRHAGMPQEIQDPSPKDAEAFVFLTGMFLRRIAQGPGEIAAGAVPTRPKRQVKA